ncbi:uncharacterized skeletal organic matrix protein 2-like isoform X1 [Actinia tenebrosa]|uniref:Uncharacterized skeletal organic matrix protein 2-like isoform X1 n=1 Tax=Actinia tenebrosa TaxID=6105 RepID=A0A6P8HPW1_ACTTE|nr:uncharacterized skeletal organic matrix protein 2-like isoform X1 [Actinia tenebrosa]XP_031554677.1 uncharacterized skeletal organic matrix protein 2-like isoform X1 [Actinia tenebrosa]
MMETPGPDGAMMKMTMETRNCIIGGMMCTEAAQQQMCQEPRIKSCNMSCCAGDLCNDGSNPPGSGVTPSKPASNVSLSCYECSPEGMGPNGTATPLISCSAPKQKKCGEIAPGMPFDRCMTVKISVKNPMTGALIEQESRNCSVSSMCSGNMLCNSMNSTGAITKCNVQCCEGSLCNTGVPQTTTVPYGGNQTTTGPSPSGPKGGQTPLAVSGILTFINIFMALIFK